MVRANILKWTGIPTSFGKHDMIPLLKNQSYCQILMRKPVFSIFVMKNGKYAKIMRNLAVEEIWGISQ